MADPITPAGPSATIMADAPVPLGDPAALRQLLVSRGMSATADDESLLRAASAAEHKLAITLLSAWEAAGMRLRDAQRAELADNRTRIERYRSTWAVISAIAPGAMLVKGSMIAAHYPAGLLRAAGDLDVICPAEQLWSAALVLIEQGWELGAFTILNARTPRAVRRAAGRAGWEPQISIALYQPSDTSIEDPYEVELRTVDVATSMRLPSWRLAGMPMSPVTASVLALVAERWERPFRSRDVFDLAVLSDHLDDADLASLRSALTVTGLWPEQRELSALLNRSGLRPAPRLAGERRSALAARSVRLLAAVRRWANPVRVLGYLSVTTVDKDRGKLADRLAQFVHERIGAWRLFRLRLPLFTVPLPAGHPGGGPDAMRLVRRGPHLVAVSPVGSFLLVAGSCQEIWLEQAAEEPAASA